MVFKNALLCVVGYVSVAMAGSTNNLKILVAGSLEPSEHKFYMSVAEGLSLNSETSNQVFVLDNDIRGEERFQVKQLNDRLSTIQVPFAPVTSGKQARLANALRFNYDDNQSDEENMWRHDAELMETYFQSRDGGKSFEFVEFLKSQKFDIAVGSLLKADKVLLNALNLPYVRLTPDDIDPYNMLMKLDLDVQLSANKNSLSYSNYNFNDVPEVATSGYRLRGLKDQVKAGVRKSNYNSIVSAKTPSQFKHLLSQKDDSLVITEGLEYDLFKTVADDDTNYVSAWPLKMQPKQVELLHMEAGTAKNMFTGKKGPVIIFNYEDHDPKSPLYKGGQKSNDLDLFLTAFMNLTMKFSRDYDVIIMCHPNSHQYVDKMVEEYNFTGNQHINVFPTANPYNVDFTHPSSNIAHQWNRQFSWVGRCNNENFMGSFKNMNASFIGISSEKISTAENFNCHKLNSKVNWIGEPLNMDSMQEANMPTIKLISALVKSMDAKFRGDHTNVQVWGDKFREQIKSNPKGLDHYLNQVYNRGPENHVSVQSKLAYNPTLNLDLHAYHSVLVLLVLFFLKSVNRK